MLTLSGINCCLRCFQTRFKSNYFDHQQEINHEEPTVVVSTNEQSGVTTTTVSAVVRLDSSGLGKRMYFMDWFTTTTQSPLHSSYWCKLSSSKFYNSKTRKIESHLESATWMCRNTPNTHYRSTEDCFLRNISATASNGGEGPGKGLPLPRLKFPSHEMGTLRLELFSIQGDIIVNSGTDADELKFESDEHPSIVFVFEFLYDSTVDLNTRFKNLIPSSRIPSSSPLSSPSDQEEHLSVRDHSSNENELSSLDLNTTPDPGAVSDSDLESNSNSASNSNQTDSNANPASNLTRNQTDSNHEGHPEPQTQLASSAATTTTNDGDIGIDDTGKDNDTERGNDDENHKERTDEVAVEKNNDTEHGNDERTDKVEAEKNNDTERANDDEERTDNVEAESGPAPESSPQTSSSNSTSIGTTDSSVSTLTQWQSSSLCWQEMVQAEKILDLERKEQARLDEEIQKVIEQHAEQLKNRAKQLREENESKRRFLKHRREQ